MPDSRRSPSGNFSGGLSPIFRISISGNEAIAAACGCWAHSPMLRTISAGALIGDERFFDPPAHLVIALAIGGNEPLTFLRACCPADFRNE
jgi:hypothetical protein